MIIIFKWANNRTLSNKYIRKPRYECSRIRIWRYKPEKMSGVLPLEKQSAGGWCSNHNPHTGDNKFAETKSSSQKLEEQRYNKPSAEKVLW